MIFSLSHLIIITTLLYALKIEWYGEKNLEVSLDLPLNLCLIILDDGCILTN